MARLPSRKELAAKVDQLERDLAIFAAGGGAGAVLARSPTARAATISGAARLTPAALAADLLIRQEDALVARGLQAAMPVVDTAVFNPLQPSLTDLATLGSIKQQGKAKPKPKSKFNKAVSKAISVIKASPSMGKKGQINNSKKAFAVATKAVSAVKRTGKVAKSGIKRKIGLAIRSILK